MEQQQRQQLTRFDGYNDGKRAQWGEKYDPSDLAPQFVKYYNSGERVRVRFAHGTVATGTVGVTTGWKPCFLLMRRRTDRGSSWTLGANDRVIAVKRGRTYVTVP